jgi:DnaJ-domain-containing protein 1
VDILDRLSLLLRSALDEPADSVRHGHTSREGPDADWREAWNELDEYMRRATDPAAGDSASHRTADRDRGTTGGDPSAMPADLRRDFENLEIAPGTPLDEVRRQFRRELARYHPDRFAGDPEKFATATAVTRELIQSYRRIRDYYGSRPG